jgi:NAD(P)-dependent dehydrogenase (short-subunit alcohol dehydrogenase family)
MSEYAGKVAVITGGASGIGLAIARKAAAEGMVVVLVDIDESALASARAALADEGATVHSYAVDVSDRDAVVALAQRVGAEVGDAWLLVNNAGVFLPGSFSEMPPEQWHFIIDVNMWGVVYGTQAFLPGMLARDSGHIINTSSVDGIVTVPNAPAYNAAKHAVTAMSETLYRELDAAGSGVGVSVLCPGAVPTNILGSARHWPSRLGPGPAVNEDPYPQLGGLISPEAVAEITFTALDERRFWILTHPDQYADAIRARGEGAATGQNPDDRSVDPNFRRETGRTPGDK